MAAAGGSVGRVDPQTLRFETPLPLRSGAAFGPYELFVETYGQLNSAKSFGEIPWNFNLRSDNSVTGCFKVLLNGAMIQSILLQKINL